MSIKQFAFTETQIAKLMQMQDELNTYIHPEWKFQGFDWETAVNDECMEILGHLGWKWWKDKTYKQDVTKSNKAQIKLELIDILHFVISSEVEREAKLNLVVTDFNIQYAGSNDGAYETVKYIQKCLGMYGVNSGTLVNLMNLMHKLDMTEVEILETYTQKYVLNKFRQDHGYKDGSYVKEWDVMSAVGEIVDGVGNKYMYQMLEDNEVLSQLVSERKSEGLDTTDEQVLYNNLSLRYHSRLNK